MAGLDGKYNFKLSEEKWNKYWQDNKIFAFDWQERNKNNDAGGGDRVIAPLCAEDPGIYAQQQHLPIAQEHAESHARLLSFGQSEQAVDHGTAAEQEQVRQQYLGMRRPIDQEEKQTHPGSQQRRDAKRPPVSQVHQRPDKVIFFFRQGTV